MGQHLASTSKFDKKITNDLPTMKLSVPITIIGIFTPTNFGTKQKIHSCSKIKLS